MIASNQLTAEELELINTKTGLYTLLKSKKTNLVKILEEVKFIVELKKHQDEFIKLQKWVIKNDKKLVILFEGRDAAGKGGAIRRITERINPRHFRTVALNIPTADERRQWFFQRYTNQLPKPGEIVFLTEVGTTERSWNRSIIFAPKKSMRFLCRKSMILKECLSNPTPT